MDDLFFERKKTEVGEWPEVLKADIFPKHVRRQCWLVWEPVYRDKEQSASYVVNMLCKKIGIHELNQSNKTTQRQRVFAWELKHFLEFGLPYDLDIFSGLDSGEVEAKNINYILSGLELICQNLKHSYKKNEIEEINKFLRRGGIGYKFIEDKLISVVDDHLTETCLEPLVGILNQAPFLQARDFLYQAYDDLKNSESSEAFANVIDNATKALESLLKIIFKEQGKENTEGLSKLIENAKKEDLLLPIAEDKSSSLLSTKVMNAIKAMPEKRNLKAGHGQLESNANYKIARLALHHATSDMLYIAETYLEQQARR